MSVSDEVVRPCDHELGDIGVDVIPPSSHYPPLKAHVFRLKWRIGQALLPKELTRERALLLHQRHIQFLEEHLQFCADILEDADATADDIEFARFEMAKAEPDLALTRLTQALHRRNDAGVEDLDPAQYLRIAVLFYEAREVLNRPEAGIPEHERFANFRDAIRCLNRLLLRLPPSERPLLVPEEDLWPDECPEQSRPPPGCDR